MRAFGADPDGPLSGLRYAVSSSTPGVVIDELSGVLSWVSGEGDAGRSISISITVTDSGTPVSSTSRSFQVNVIPFNASPIIAEIAPQSAQVDELLFVDVEGSDPDFPLQSLTWSLGAGAPSNMRIDSDTGLITWSPPAFFTDQNIAVEVILTDSGIPSASSIATLAIDIAPRENQAPDLAQLPVAIWTEGQLFSLEIFASDFENDPITLAANLSSFANSQFTDLGLSLIHI